MSKRPRTQASASLRYHSVVSSGSEDYRKPLGPWWKGHHINATVESGKPDDDPESPYELKGVRMQGKYSKGGFHNDASCGKFFPYVGNLRPKQTRGIREWDVWEDAFAYVAGCKMFIARCTDDVPGCMTTMWEVSIDPHDSIKSEKDLDELYDISWTINPWNLHPMVIAVGKHRLIYVFDCVERRLVRVLEGHGSFIVAVRTHPTQLHIIATASADHSIRIWNIWGSRAAPARIPRKNHSQAKADEGTILIAVLAGEPFGGHRDEVHTISWHPKHAAIASGGKDHCLKIWPVPPLPPIPDAYRPEQLIPSPCPPIVIHTPLFSTARINSNDGSSTDIANVVDGVEWITEDVLMVRTMQMIALVQWIGYLRYFSRRKYELLGAIDDIPAADWQNSASFTYISRFHYPQLACLKKADYHPAFTPRADLDEHEDDSVVTTHLIIVPLSGSFQEPRLILYAPTLAPQDPTPPLDTRRRTIVGDESEEEGEQYDEKEEKEEKEGEKGKEEKVEGDSAGSNAGRTGHSDIDETKKDIGRQCDWKISAKGWTRRLKFQSQELPYKMPPAVAEGWLNCAAVSPRGAKWVIGAGRCESIFVWRQKDVLAT